MNVVTPRHEEFLRGLRGSSDAVFAVARWLHGKRLDVAIPALHEAPTHHDARRFRDDGDLFVRHKRRWLRVEVKGLKYTFTGRDDWPNRDRVFLARQKVVERLRASVYAWVSVSPNLRHGIVIRKATSPHWFLTDPVSVRTSEGMMERFYACPIDHVEFVDLI